jgi:IS5 family transposase
MKVRRRPVRELGDGRPGGFASNSALVDTKVRPIYIASTPGQRHEMLQADELLANASDKAFIADARYDSDRFPKAIRDKMKRAVIGSKPERARKLPKSRALYSMRLARRVLLPNLKRFRAIATRFETAARELPCTHPTRMRVARARVKRGQHPL